MNGIPGNRFYGRTYVGDGSAVADGKERAQETTEDRILEEQESCKNLQDRIPGFQDSNVTVTMFTCYKKIQELIEENQENAENQTGNVMTIEIGQDCVRIQDDGADIRDVFGNTVWRDLNMKRKGSFWINNFCGPQLVLEPLVSACNKKGIKLSIKIVDQKNF